MIHQKPTPAINVHWTWIPPVIVLGVAVGLRLLLGEQYEALSTRGQSVVDLVVPLSPVLGLIVPVYLLARKRKERQNVSPGAESRPTNGLSQ